jgi:hypothetical protein
MVMYSYNNERGKTMMFANEMTPALKRLKADEMEGDCYFLDKNGERKVVDYLYEDEEGNLILTEYGNPNIPENKRAEG